MDALLNPMNFSRTSCEYSLHEHLCKVAHGLFQNTIFIFKTQLLFSYNFHREKQVNKTNARTSFGHCPNKNSRLKLTEINTSWQV